MVTRISHETNQAISSSIMEAERLTDAEIVVVITPASDTYQSYVLLVGLALGSLLASSLWAARILTAFPLLLMVQLAVIALFSFIPFLCAFCVHFVPKQILHHRAAHRAYEEYLAVSQKVTAVTPIVLLYISLAERYAHILHSRIVHEKIPDEIWNSIINKFTAEMPKTSLHEACTHAIEHIAKLLTPHFPATNNVNHVSNNVVEI